MEVRREDISAALEAPLRPPMLNGEVLFEEPWQGRVFGMAIALHDAGLFAWSEFQQSLIEVIGEWDSEGIHGQPYQYYHHFQDALNRLLTDKGLVTAQTLELRTAAIADRPHGHDH